MTLLTDAVRVPTSEEILRAQDEGGVEFVNGQLVEKPVSTLSSYVAGRILSLLNIEAFKTKSVLVFDCSLGYQCFPDDPRKFRKPDVSVVRSSRMKGLEPNPGLFPLPPDLAVEVISENELYSDVLEKVEEYLHAGFPLIWVVDPPTRTVNIYRRDGSTRALRERDEITGESAMESFKCNVADFFVMPSMPA